MKSQANEVHASCNLVIVGGDNVGKTALINILNSDENHTFNIEEYSLESGKKYLETLNNVKNTNPQCIKLIVINNTESSSIEDVGSFLQDMEYKIFENEQKFILVLNKNDKDSPFNKKLYDAANRSRIGYVEISASQNVGIDDLINKIDDIHLGRKQKFDYLDPNFLLKVGFVLISPVALPIAAVAILLYLTSLPVQYYAIKYGIMADNRNTMFQSNNFGRTGDNAANVVETQEPTEPRQSK